MSVYDDVKKLMRYPEYTLNDVGTMPMGKGMYIYILERLGDPEEVVSLLKAAGYKWAAIKLQSGRIFSEGIKKESEYFPLVKKYVEAFEGSGIDLFGWGYVRLDSDDQVLHEIATTVDAIKYFNIKGWIVNAEAEAKGNAKRASRYFGVLRQFIGDYRIGFTSYRWPSYHPTFPWKEFFDGCDYAHPQVYWVEAHNPEGQLTKCIDEYQEYSDMTIQPIGCAYPWGGWKPLLTDFDVFYDAVKKFGLTAFSWWEMYYPIKYGWWDALALHDADVIDEPEEPEENMWKDNARGLFVQNTGLDINNDIAISEFAEKLKPYAFLFSKSGSGFTATVQAAFNAERPVALFFENDPELYRDMALGAWPAPDDDPQIKVIDSMLRMASGAMRKVHAVILDCSKVLMSDGDKLTAAWIAEHSEHMANVIEDRYGLPVHIYMNGDPLKTYPNNQQIIGLIERRGISTVGFVEEVDGFPINDSKPNLPYYGSKGWDFWLYSAKQELKFLYNGTVSQLYEAWKFKAGDEPTDPGDDPIVDPIEEPSDFEGLSKFEKMVIVRLDNISNLL